jgi:hypothetical protein
MAAKGWALPDGSYPIKTRQDVKNAIRLVGQGNAPNAVIKKHIIKRAKALNSMDLIPPKWTGSEMNQSMSRKDALSHFGVKGMRWGVRRDQARAIGRLAGPAAKGLKKNVTAKEFTAKVKAAGGLHKVSDKQLQTMLKRMEMEKKFNTMLDQDKERRIKGLAAAGKILGEIGKIGLPVLLAAAGTKLASDRGVFRTTATVVGKRAIGR